MSRHTTSFTADPVYRARQEIRNRLQRLQEEARTTVDCMASFGETAETAMWRQVVAQTDGMVQAINTANEIERVNKTEAASAARRQPLSAGHNLESIYVSGGLA